MFDKITEIGKKLLEDADELDWDDLKGKIDPLLNKKMDLFRHIEKNETKKQLVTCNICDCMDMFPVNRKKKTGKIYTVMRCNRCGSCNLGDGDDD